MAIFLQLDGVDDRVSIPTMSFNKLVMDVVYYDLGRVQIIYDLRPGLNWGYTQINANGTVARQSDAAVKETVNDTTTEPSNNSMYLPFGTRILHKIETSTVISGIITIGSANNGVGFSRVDVYDIKVYNGTALIAHYDMSVGTVQDQSGNGNHATLAGGTWVDDGPSAPVGENVSYTFPTRQVMTASRSSQAAMQQVVTATRVQSAAMRQVSYSARSEASPTTQRVFAIQTLSAETRQVITAQRSEAFPMLQHIYSGHVLFEEAYPLRIAIHAQRTESASLTVRIVTVRTNSFPVLQRLFAMRISSNAMEQRVTEQRKTVAATRQAIYADRVYSYPIKVNVTDPNMPAYKRRISFRVELTTKRSFSTGIARRKQYDIRW